MRISALTLFILSCIIGFAQTNNVADTITSQSSIEEVTINAPIHIHNINQWPGSVSTIDSLGFEMGNSYQIAQQLNSLPGVFMQEGTLNTSRITIRGVGSRTPYNTNRIKIYWGDIPLTDGDGVSSIEDISFNDIGDLLVLKGPSSALYGAGLGGVILINPWESPPTNNTFRLKSEVASYGTFTNQASLAISHNKGTTWINASQLYTNGYRDNSEYKRYNITAKGKYQAETSYLHFLYNFRHFTGEIPSSLDSLDFTNNPEKAAESWAAIEGYENSKRHIFNIGLNSSFSASLIHSVNLYSVISVLDELRPFNQLEESKSAIGLRDKLSYQNKTLRVDVGIEGQMEFNDIKHYGVKDHNKGEILNANKLRRSYINAFALLDYSHSKNLVLQTGFNLNWTHYKNTDKFSNNKTSHQYPLVFSPRIGINYTASKASNWFAAAGHGFSAPSLEEVQLPDGSFNSSIKPEEGIHVDLGYRYQSASNRTNTEITAYWMQMTNLLVTKRESEDVFYGINAGKTNHKGIEIMTNQVIPIHSNKLTLSSSFTYSINQFTDFTDNENNFDGNHLPGIPTYTAFIQANYHMNKSSVLINYRHNGKQYLNDENSKQYESFGVLNAKINHSIRVSSVKANIYFGINNLLNTHYASMLLVNAPSFGNKLPRYYYPALPFNMYGGITFSL